MFKIPYQNHVLDEVDRKVEGLKKTFERTTTEAARLKVDLEKAQETIGAAENLVGKLEGEFERWNGQASSFLWFIFGRKKHRSGISSLGVTNM